MLLNQVAGATPLYEYELAGRVATITPVKLTIAALIAFFTLLELSPAMNKMAIDRRYIPLGGILSGFFGGLSGHQGALRTAFLIRAGLDKEPLLGTMAVSSVVVDVSRLIVYGVTFFGRNFALLREQGGQGLVIAATLAAFVGTFAGTRLVKKVTLDLVHRVVGIMLLLLAVVMGAGII
jgi:uncharacterized membrane protein YfcA